MALPSKFSEVMSRGPQFTGRSVFYRPAFSAFYRLFSKIGDLWDIDLKFPGFISDVNSDNPAPFHRVSMPRSCISKISFFGILLCNLQNGSAMSKFFWFFVSLWIPTSCKNVIAIPFVFPEILGKVPLSCLKRQMPLTVKPTSYLHPYQTLSQCHKCYSFRPLYTKKR